MSRREESDHEQMRPAAGISIVVNRDGGEDVPISSSDFGRNASTSQYHVDLTASSPSNLAYHLDTPLFSSSLDPSTGPAWLDGVGSILSAQEDRDYFPSSGLHLPSPEPEPYPPSPLLPFSGDDFYITNNALNSPLVPSFNSLSISSPLLPSPTTDFDYSAHESHSRPDAGFDFLNPPLLQLPSNLLSSGSSSPSFLAVDRSSALFGDENKDSLFDRTLPSLRVDTILSSPEGIQHSPSPLSEPSPFPSSPFPPPSLTHSSPSAYSPHALPSSLLPPASNYSTLSGALDDTAVSDSGLDDPLEAARIGFFIGPSRRHSHTGLRENMAILMGPNSDEYADARPSSDMDGLGIPTRAGGSSRSALTPELPRLQLEGVGHDISRGRAADRLALSTPGSRRASRSPYARPHSETKDISQSSGNGHKRNKTYDQFLNVPGVGPAMRLQPPTQGNSHQRRHSTGNHPRESPPEQSTSLTVPGPPRGFTVPMLRSSASDRGLSMSPESFQSQFLLHSPESESPGAGPSRRNDTDESFSEKPVRRSARVRAAVAEEEPSGSEVDADDAKDNVRRETIASSATLKASGNRRKNDVKFFCPICSNGFTAKHNLQRHLLAHKGEKPYGCKCGQSFTNKWDRTRHQKKSRLPACSK